METLPGRTSPAIWTTVVTGRTPRDHGIPAWVVRGEDGERALVTSNMRRAPAIWDVLGDAGMRSSIVGWIVSWPASPIEGSMVTSYSPLVERAPTGLERTANPKKGFLWRDLPHQTWPGELLEEVIDLRRSPAEVSPRELGRFVSLERIDESERDQSLLQSLRYVLAADGSFARIAGELFARERTAFGAVYLGGVDAVSHRFWRFSQPSPIPTTDEDRARFGRVISEYYRRADEILGELLEGLDPQTLVLVCSDHGFEAAEPLEHPDALELEQSGKHRPTAVLLLHGPGVEAGARIDGASVFDICPTTLALLGLPVADDMPGRVLLEAFEPDLARGEWVQTLPSYQHLAPEGGKPLPSSVDDEILDQLRSLGYIR